MTHFTPPLLRAYAGARLHWSHLYRTEKQFEGTTMKFLLKSSASDDEMLFHSEFDLNSEENRFSKKSLLLFWGVTSYVNRFMNISTKLILLLNELDSISNI